MVGQVNNFINIVMIKKAQWFWSKLETTSLEDTLIKLGKVRISQKVTKLPLIFTRFLKTWSRLHLRMNTANKKLDLS